MTFDLSLRHPFTTTEDSAMKLLRASSLAIFIMLLSGCTAPDRAVQTLTDAGYSNIKIGEYAWFSCSEDDVYRTRFEATGVTGRTVTGAVCNGFFKGATIRFD
jgi:hypothetical protein